MESTYRYNLERLRTVKGVKSYLVPEDEGGAERVLLAFILDGYADELRNRLGLRESSQDDLGRLSTAKDIMRSIGIIFDAMAQEIPEGEQSLSTEMMPLFIFLRDTSLDLAHTVRVIEASHPNLAIFFDTERRLYAESLLGKGPLAMGAA